MISGPTPPHPRVVLKELLARSSEHEAEFPQIADTALETGLVVVEEGLRVGRDLRVDFLARDAAGVPVLILTVDAEDEAWAPLRIVDVDLWFRENAILLERGLSRIDPDRSALQWSGGFRIFVVCLDTSPRLLRRLEAIGGVSLEVYELRSIFVRGETLWFVQGIEPWRRPSLASVVADAPEGLDDPVLAELAESLLARVPNLASDVEILGDRFCREIAIDGSSVLRLEVRGAGLVARVTGRTDAMPLRTGADADRILDALMRAVLDAQPAPAEPDRLSANANDPGILRLSDEELAALTGS